MDKYVDGFVLVIPADKAEEYKQQALYGRDLWMKHGAVAYYECKANDLTQNDMGGEKTRAFGDMAGAQAGEDVWFSFIVFKSKAHRDEVNAQVMAAMAAEPPPQPGQAMLFDMTRMAYGGFAVEVEG